MAALIPFVLVVVILASLVHRLVQLVRRPQTLRWWLLVLDVLVTLLLLVVLRGSATSPVLQWAWLACGALFAVLVGFSVARAPLIGRSQQGRGRAEPLSTAAPSGPN